MKSWNGYDRGLVHRGNIRMWNSAEAIAGWRPACRTAPGGQWRFSDLAIEATLLLGALVRFTLRQTEGFVRSLLALMRLDLAVPDHTTLARRRRTVAILDLSLPRKGPVDIIVGSTGLKFYNPGDWARE